MSDDQGELGASERHYQSQIEIAQFVLASVLACNVVCSVQRHGDDGGDDVVYDGDVVLQLCARVVIVLPVDPRVCAMWQRLLVEKRDHYRGHTGGQYPCGYTLVNSPKIA